MAPPSGQDFAPPFHPMTYLQCQSRIVAFALTLAVAAISLMLAGCGGLNRKACPLPPGVRPLAASHADRGPTWTAGDGRTFPVTIWKNRGVRPKAAVVVIPGWDAALGDYANIGGALAKEGMAVYGMELRWQRWDPVVPERGDPADWHRWVTDAREFIEWVRRREPRLPVIVHGHSFGSMVAMQAAAEMPPSEEPLAGLIVHSPGFPFMQRQPSWLVGSLHALTAVRLPHLWIMKKRGVRLSDDRLWNCRWMNSDDRLMEGYKGRYLLEAYALGQEVRKSSRTLDLPILALAGDRDTLVAPDGPQMAAYLAYLQRELAGGNAESKIIHGQFHVLNQGSSQNAVLNAIRRWVWRTAAATPQ